MRTEGERERGRGRGRGVARTVEREGLREIRYIVYSLVPRTLKVWEQPGDEAKRS